MNSDHRSPKLQNLFLSGKSIAFAKGDMIASTDESDTIMMLQEGFIKRYMISNSGNLGVQIVYGPQDVFLLARAFRLLLQQSLYDGPEVYYYQAMADGNMLILDSKIFVQAVEAEIELYKELFSEVGRHLKASIQSIECMSLINVYAQVAHQLLFFAREFGEPEKRGTAITVPLTHQDIANLIGSTRETVTRTIGKLKRLGILAGDKRMVVTDIDRLAKEAYS
jgi:CRP-like cAMP-binding protein